KRVAAQGHEGLPEIFGNRSPGRELVIGYRVGARRGAEWIYHNRNAAIRVSRRTNRAIVKVDRAVEYVSLSRVVTLEIKDQIPHRFIGMRKSGGGSDRIRVEELGVDYSVNGGLVDPTIFCRN